MLLATLRNYDEIRGFVKVNRLTWTIPERGRYGEAQFEIPKTSAMASTSYIDDEDGGSFVRFEDGILDVWEGTITKIDSSRDMLLINAIHDSSLLQNFPIERQKIVYGRTPGALIHMAWSSSAASSIFKKGRILDAAPSLHTYEFNYQTFGQMLDDLVDTTGQEYRVRPGAILDFGPPRGQLYPNVLNTDADIANERRSVSTERNVTRVVARTTSGLPVVRESAQLSRSRLAGKSLVVDVPTDSHIVAGIQAERILNELRRSQVVFQVELMRLTLEETVITEYRSVARKLPSELPLTDIISAKQAFHWTRIREGTRVLVHLTVAGLTGKLALCRVLSRTYSDASGTLGLELQYLRPFDALTPISTMMVETVPRFFPGSSIVRAVRAAGATINQPQDVRASDLIGQIGPTQYGRQSIPSAAYRLGSVQAPHIGDDMIQPQHVAPGTINNSNMLGTDVVLQAAMANSSVGTNEQIDDSVTRPKIGPNAVGRNEIEDGEVIGSKLPDDVITRLKILNGEVIRTKMPERVIDRTRLDLETTTTPPTTTTYPAGAIPNTAERWVWIRTDDGSYVKVAGWNGSP